MSKTNQLVSRFKKKYIFNRTREKSTELDEKQGKSRPVEEQESTLGPKSRTKIK